MEVNRAERLKELLANIRAEAEEASFLLGRMPDADQALIVALDKIMKLTNEC